MIVVIPSYQPDEKLVKLVGVLTKETDFPIVIVDDGSDADKQKFFKQVEKKAVILHHDVNKGKGVALKTAFEYIHKNMPKEEGVVTIDSDGQHLPKDIVRVVEAWRKNPKALVLGSRRFTGNVPFKSILGNTITRVAFAVTTGVKVYDTQTGLRAFGYDLIPAMIAIEGNRFEYEINVLLYSTKKKIPIEEVTIETVYINENASSHYRPIRDSMRIFKMILLFVLSSLSSFLVDVVAFALLGWIFGLFGVSADQGKLLSEILARFISASFNFVVNKELVFEGKGKMCALRYALTALVILGLDYALLLLFTNVLHIPSILAKIMCGIVCYPVSFFLQRVFVFKEKKD